MSGLNLGIGGGLLVTLVCVLPSCSSPTPKPRSAPAAKHASVAPASSGTVAVRGDEAPAWPNVTVKVEDVPLGTVMHDITRHTGKLIYFSDPAIANERVTVSLTNVPWSVAVGVVTRMAVKTPFLYADGAFIDWACTDWLEPPDWSAMGRLGHLARRSAD